MTNLAKLQLLIEAYETLHLTEIDDFVTSLELDEMALIEKMTDRDEESISVDFDTMVDERIEDMNYPEAKEYLSDTIAIEQDFAAYIDDLAKSGEIYDLQYSNYGYIGKYKD